MTPEQYLVNLIDNPPEDWGANVDFLKKYLMTAHLASLRVNGQSPDARYSLGNYLLDDERVMLDYTRLDNKHKKLFTNWFLKPHEDDFESVFQSDYKISEYRGYSAEVKLTWWGRFLNSWFFKRHYKKLPLSKLELSLDYQLNDIEISHGENGISVGFSQHALPPQSPKYHPHQDGQEKPLKNTKRVYLTNQMVEQLAQSDMSSKNTAYFDNLIKRAHPLAIHVETDEERMNQMRQHRRVHGYLMKKSWWRRLVDWTKTLFKEPPKKTPIKKNYFDLFNVDELHIKINDKDGKIIVTEPKPSTDKAVFCGGGSKIIGHVGALDALYEAGIRLDKFAGSSAGAIISLLGYLGYPPQEILAHFKHFNQEILVNAKFSRKGFSSPKALKAAINSMIIDRFNEIKSALNATEQGYAFLTDNYYNNNHKVTFRLLKDIKKHFPKIACQFNLGEDLIVTGTNINQKKTDFFSYETTPDIELADAVTASACFPILYKPVTINGVVYKDGGLLNNFPIELFKDDGTTFLESKYGIDYKVMGFQFDNGHERNLLDTLQRKVYRENFLYNKIVGMITGVDDPVGGWHKDRIKVIKYGPGVVIIPCDNVSSTNFQITDETRAKLFEHGKRATERYLKQRYRVKKTDSEPSDSIEDSYELELDEHGRAINEELIYQSFESMEELLGYCYYRNRQPLFDELVKKILDNPLLFSKEENKRLRFKINQLNKHFQERNQDSDFDLDLSVDPLLVNGQDEELETPRNNSLFKTVHSLFVKTLGAWCFGAKQDVKNFESIRFNISIDDPEESIKKIEKYFKHHEGDVNLLPYLVREIYDWYFDDDTQAFEQQINRVNYLLKNPVLQFQLKQARCFDSWELTIDECFDRLKLEVQDFLVNPEAPSESIDTLQTWLKPNKQTAHLLPHLLQLIYDEHFVNDHELFLQQITQVNQWMQNPRFQHHIENDAFYRGWPSSIPECFEHLSKLTPSESTFASNGAWFRESGDLCFFGSGGAADGNKLPDSLAYGR